MDVRPANVLLCVGGGIASALLIALDIALDAGTTHASSSTAGAHELRDGRPGVAGGSPSLEPVPVRSRESGDDSGVAPTTEPEDRSGRVSAPSQASESSTSAGSSRPSSGLLRMGAIDAETDARISCFRVRAASVERLADYATQYSSSTLDLRLSPGTYSLLVMSAGYEPTQIDGVRIADRASIRFEDVRLYAGGGRLLGTVRGARFDGDLRVELLGDGRHPCSRCPSSDFETCTTCGYSRRGSRVPVDRDGRFVFERLASGTYSIFLSDGANRILCPPTALDLGSGEALRVALEMPPLRELRLEILDTDGSSLSEDWAGRVRVERSKEEKIEFIDLPGFEGVIRDGDLELASLWWAAPAPDGRPGGGTHVVSTCCLLPRNTGGSEIDDVPRDPLEPLRPTAPPPTVHAAKLFLHVQTDGAIVVERMPASGLTIDVSCGPFHGTAEVVASTGSMRVPIALSLDGSVPATPEERTYRGYEARRYGSR